MTLKRVFVAFPFVAGLSFFAFILFHVFYPDYVENCGAIPDPACMYCQEPPGDFKVSLADAVARSPRIFVARLESVEDTFLTSLQRRWIRPRMVDWPFFPQYVGEFLPQEALKGPLNERVSVTFDGNHMDNREYYANPDNRREIPVERQTILSADCGIMAFLEVGKRYLILPDAPYSSYSFIQLGHRNNEGIVDRVRQMLSK